MVCADHVWNANLGKFVNVDTEVYDTPETQFDYAKKLENAGDFDEAKKAYENLFRMFPNTDLAQDALLQLGTLQENDAEYIQAFKNYQKIIDNYPQTEKLDEITKRQFQIGNVFFSGVRGKFFHVPILPALPQAINVFEKIVANAPYSFYGMRAQYNLGLVYKKSRKFRDAIREFKTFVENYPRSDLRREAFFEIAETLFSMSMSNYNDKKLLAEAQEQLTEYRNRFHDTPEAEDAHRMLETLAERDAQKIYDVARYYEGESYLESAILYYKELIDAYPDSSWAQKAQKRLNTFEDPEKFLIEGQVMLEEKLEKLHEEKDTLEDSYKEDKLDTYEFQGKLIAVEYLTDTIKGDLKRIEKEKKKEAKTRWLALQRKKRELKERKKKLKKKEDHLQAHPSQDLATAIARWEQSLKAEEYALKIEERELLALEKKLGLRRIISLTDVITGRRRSIADITQFREKKLHVIVAEEKKVAEEKQDAYKELDEIEQDIEQLEREQEALLDTEIEKKKVFTQEEQRLMKEKSTLYALKSEMKRKKREYKKRYGFLPSFMRLPYPAVSGLISPFTKTPQEKIEDQIQKAQDEKDTLLKAVADEEEELKRYIQVLKGSDTVGKGSIGKDLGDDANDTPVKDKRQERIDKREARKKVMTIEKRINQAHSAIEDAYTQKEKILPALEKEINAIKEKRSTSVVKIANSFSKPFRGTWHVFDMFIFGMKEREDVVRQQADELEKKVTDEQENAQIRLYKQQIKEQDEYIRKNELSIVALEIELESLVAQLKGLIAERKEKDISHNKAIIEKEITQKKKYIQALNASLAQQEEVLVDLLSQQRSLHTEDDSDDTTQKKSLMSDEEARSEKEALLEKELNEYQQRIIEQETIVRNIEESLDGKRSEMHGKDTTKHFWEKFEKADAQINRQLEELFKEEDEKRKNIAQIIERQETLYGAHHDGIQEKIEFVKKRILQLEKYQDEELPAVQEIQKQLFEELDAINSTRQKLRDEREQMSDEKTM